MLFYAVPTLACLSTGALAGLSLLALGTISLTFRNAGQLGTLSVIGGASVASLLGCAMMPTWKALKQQGNCKSGCSSSFLEPGLGSLRSYCAITIGSLGFSMGTLAIIIYGFYQTHLTPAISDPEAYRSLVKDSRAWLESQKSIAPENNGWIELRPFLVRSEQANHAIVSQLKAGREYYEGKTETRDSFLAVLPLIESALRKPEFSHVATEEIGFHGHSPDFMAYRSVAQGLTALARDATDPGQALHYIALNLRWARKSEPTCLIDHMIAISQHSIALETVEAWIKKADQAQLRELLATLQATQLPASQFFQALRNEAYLADLAFQSLLEDGDNFRGDFAPWMAWLPNSYWESERKAYLNLHAEQQIHSNELTISNEVNVSERLPFSIGARILIPNTNRAQERFMETHSRHSFMILRTALEIYRLEKGNYPDRLEQLDLEQLPYDMLDPRRLGKKRGFGYRKTSGGYQLKGAYEKASKPR